MWKEIILWIFLAVNTVTDIRTKKINIIWSVIFGILGIVVFAAGGDKEWISLISGIAVGVYLLAFAKMTKESIGLGDGFMVTAAGIWMGGARTLAVLMGGFVAAAVFGLSRICAGKASGKSELAFAPFFTVSYIVLYLGGFR